ncbi:hypothetical protein Bbelb_115670 [Branchiostoma belcheri]|nr:hypothetical protein Bbelb_115670 [Branchiostoma belcheri]
MTFKDMLGSKFVKCSDCRASPTALCAKFMLFDCLEILEHRVISRFSFPCCHGDAYLCRPTVSDDRFGAYLCEEPRGSGNACPDKSSWGWGGAVISDETLTLAYQIPDPAKFRENSKVSQHLKNRPYLHSATGTP